MFHNYIVQHWKPAALQNLEAVTLKVKRSIFDLGTPVELLSPAAVMDRIQRQVGTFYATASFVVAAVVAWLVLHRVLVCSSAPSLLAEAKPSVNMTFANFPVVHAGAL